MKGIGTDIIEIARIHEAIKESGDLFLQRLFTEKERAYCESFAKKERQFAGRFAAKEAIAKALGVGFGESLSFLDIEILPEASGKPLVQLSTAAQDRFGHTRLLLSISHCNTYATAVALLL